MKIRGFILEIFSKFIRSPFWIKIIIISILIGSSWFLYYNLKPKSAAIQYQTTTVEKGTLIVSVTGSGQVVSANNVQATTLASGVVSKIYVKDGDSVKTGDKIVELELDLVGRQRYNSALASYEGAKNSLDNAKAALYTSNTDLFNKWESFYDLATNPTYQNSDKTPNSDNRTNPEFIKSQNDWLASEIKYKTQLNAIKQAQIALNSSWQSLQQSSPIIYAPISGKIAGMSLQIGNVINASTNTTSGNATSVKIANIITQGLPSISVNLSEIDVPKVAIGNKTTVTLDALPDKTFTGTVVSVDTVGGVFSGVTSYPAVIRLDLDNQAILPNMSATANIITQTKDNVIMVPTSAVQTQNGSSTVRIMKNRQVNQVNVEVGLVSDSQTEIISGVNEGDTVVTSTISTATSTNNNPSGSPFGVFGGGVRTGGGGQVRFRD